MLRAFEDLPAIGALALEHRARIVQAVGKHVQGGLAPGHELAVVPDDPFEAVVRFFCHGVSPRRWSCAGGRRIVPVLMLLRRGPTPGMFRPVHESALAPLAQSARGGGRGHDPFVAAFCWITI